MKHAEVITKDKENKLWESRQLSTRNPRALQNAVFYYNGINFCLHGGDEHRQLKISQLECVHNPDGFLYHEYVSKNNSVHSGRITFLKRKYPFMLVLKLEIGVTFICSLCIWRSCLQKHVRRISSIVVHWRMSSLNLRLGHGTLLFLLESAL